MEQFQGLIFFFFKKHSAASRSNLDDAIGLFQFWSSIFEVTDKKSYTKWWHKLLLFYFFFSIFFVVMVISARLKKLMYTRNAQKISLEHKIIVSAYLNQLDTSRLGIYCREL